MYLQVISNMLDGVIYKRAINSKAIKKYFDNIWNDFGIEALKSNPSHKTSYKVQERIRISSGFN